MPGLPVPLGPFVGGMNNAAEIGTVADDEVSLAENFEMDSDGSLVSRPAIIPEEPVSPATGNMQPLGYYVRADNETFLVVATATNTRLYQLSTKTWQTIWANVASGFVQYDNKVVLISETVAGGYWEGGVFTSTPTMPLASSIVFYQERFWAFGVRGTANATTVWFSKLTVISPPSTIFDWVTGSDFFTVNKGDGEWITGMVADTSALLIFRNSSTYQFTFPSSPLQGTLRVISKTIGADNKWAFGAYENYYFVMNAGFLYQFINYRYYPLNTKKIDFNRASLLNPLQFDVRVSIFNRRVVVWFFGAVYVYKIVTTTWSTWVSELTRAGQFFTVPPSSISGESRTAIAITGENSAALKKLYRIEEDVLGTGSGEMFTCLVRTKSYSFDEAAQYKRLLYTAIEARSSLGLEIIAHPVALSSTSTTWNAMNLVNWNDLGTWNNPLVPPVDFEDDIDFPTLAPIMTVSKARMPVRFLRIYFEIFMQTNGTAKTAPTRIYSITPYLKVHAGVSKKVS